MSNQHFKSSQNKTLPDFETFQAMVQKTGFRLTSKRRLLLEQLLKNQRPISAYELSEQLLKECALKIPVMSIYRFFHALEKHQLVHKLSLVNKYVTCSHLDCCDHEQTMVFLICFQCKDVDETVIDSDILAMIQQRSKASGFTINQEQIEIFGQCKACNKLPGDSLHA